MLTDDRRPSFERWLERKLDGLAAGIRQDVEAWLRTMRNGGPRTKPRDIASVWNLMNHLRPTLTGWSDRYDHLREVTRNDVIAILASCTDHAAPTSWSPCDRCSRSARSKGRSSGTRPAASRSASIPTVSPSPSARTTSTRPPEPPRPRQPAGARARRGPRRPHRRHPRHPAHDVDLGNRRLTITGRVRPIDEFTHQICSTGSATGAPAGQTPPTRTCSSTSTRRWAPGQSARSLRQDQTPRPGRDPGTAPRRPATRGSPRPRPRPAAPGSSVRPRPQDRHRYAENARLLLTTRADEQDPASSTEPKGQNHP